MPRGLVGRVLRVWATPTVASRAPAAESPPPAYSRRSVCGPPYHVGCESLVAPEDLRKQALRQVAPGQWLPASWSLKGPGMSHETRSEEHTSELQSRLHLVCRLLLEKKKKKPDMRQQQNPTDQSD